MAIRVASVFAVLAVLVFVGLRLARPGIPASCAGCNVILISLDTLRADRIGFLGSDRDLTPHLDAIAKRSRVFTNAYANAFYTTPSHMSVFTSLYPQVHHVEARDVRLPRHPERTEGGSRLDPESKTMAEVLSAAGYRTVWSAPLGIKHLERVLGFGRGFVEFLPPVFRRALEQTAFGKSSIDANALGQALEKPGSAFLFLHSFVSHLPYVAESRPGLPPLAASDLTKGFTAQLKERKGLLKRIPLHALNACGKPESLTECWSEVADSATFLHSLGQWQLSEWQKAWDAAAPAGRERLQTAITAAYEAQIRDLDEQLGRVWSTLEKKGLLANSVVVLFSDHGEELFDHGHLSHSSFHEHTARIPLLIYSPKLEAKRDERMVSLIDIAPTVLAHVGAAKLDGAQGRDLFANEVEDLDVVGASLGDVYARGRRFKLIRLHDGSEQLFDLRGDPRETVNLIDSREPLHLDALSCLRQSLSQVALSGRPGACP